MTKRSANHHTFTLERAFDATPQQVFHAYTDKAAKARWFSGPDDWETKEFELDVRPGGKEFWRGGQAGGPEHRNDTLYLDVVPNERIICTFYMHVGGTLITCSLLTTEIRAEGKRTRVIHTEQIVYLDGVDHHPQRIEGTEEMLNALGRELESAK